MYREDARASRRGVLGRRLPKVMKLLLLLLLLLSINELGRSTAGTIAGDGGGVALIWKRPNTLDCWPSECADSEDDKGVDGLDAAVTAAAAVRAKTGRLGLATPARAKGDTTDLVSGSPSERVATGTMSGDCCGRPRRGCRVGCCCGIITATGCCCCCCCCWW